MKYMYNYSSLSIQFHAGHNIAMYGTRIKLSVADSDPDPVKSIELWNKWEIFSENKWKNIFCH